MNKTLIYRAVFLAAAAGAVHIIVLISVDGLELLPLTAALAASIVFALVIAVGSSLRTATVRREGHKPKMANVVSRISKSSVNLVPTLIAVLVVLWPVTAIFGHAADFYCVPAVPWNIEIAVFGAFVISMLKYMTAPLPYPKFLEMLIYASLFWIAPFYGFFSAPYFLGMNIVTPCPDRQILEIVLASAAMVIAAALAETVGAFLSARK